MGTNRFGGSCRVDVRCAGAGYRFHGLTVLHGVVSVDQKVFTVCVLEIDGYRRVIEHRTQSFLALAERPLGVLAVSQIAQQHQDERLAVRFQHRGGDLHGNFDTAPGAAVELQGIGTAGDAPGADQAPQPRHGVREHPCRGQLFKLAGRVFQKLRDPRVGVHDALAQRIDDQYPFVTGSIDVRQLLLDPRQALLAARANRALDADHQFQRIGRLHQRRTIGKRAGFRGDTGKTVARVHHDAQLRILLPEGLHGRACG